MLSGNMNMIENLRYLLSALIQSEAAILGIVVSINLISQQILAEKYHVSILKFDKKLLPVIVIYTISIFYKSYHLLGLKIDSQINHWQTVTPISLFLMIIITTLVYAYQVYKSIRNKTHLDSIVSKIRDTELFELGETKSTKRNDQDGLQVFEELALSFLHNRRYQDLSLLFKKLTNKIDTHKNHVSLNKNFFNKLKDMAIEAINDDIYVGLRIIVESILRMPDTWKALITLNEIGQFALDKRKFRLVWVVSENLYQHIDELRKDFNNATTALRISEHLREKIFKESNYNLESAFFVNLIRGGIDRLKIGLELKDISIAEPIFEYLDKSISKFINKFAYEIKHWFSPSFFPSILEDIVKVLDSAFIKHDFAIAVKENESFKKSLILYVNIFKNIVQGLKNIRISDEYIKEFLAYMMHIRELLRKSRIKEYFPEFAKQICSLIEGINKC